MSPKAERIQPVKTKDWAREDKRALEELKRVKSVADLEEEELEGLFEEETSIER